MFQIALFAQEPFTLFNMLAAARYLTIRRPVGGDLGRLSYEQMENRLNRISSGLLETTNATRPLYGRRAAHTMKVQFIHQTVKEFMMTENGGRLIRENVGNNPVENGNILIFRYIVAQIGFIRGEIDSDQCDDRQRFALDNFYNYAQAIELSEDMCAATYIETSSESTQASKEDDILSRILLHDYEAKWGKIFEDYHSDSMIQKLLFYTLCDLPFSLTRTLESYGYSVCEREISVLLLKALFKLPRSEETKPRQPSPRIIRILLDWGVSNNITRDDLASLQNLVRFRASQVDQRHLVSEEVLDLWHQFEADVRSAGWLADVRGAGWSANPPYRERSK